MNQFLHRMAGISRLRKVSELALLLRHASDRLAFQAADNLPFKSALVIAPHPDDEAIGPGGLILNLKQAGLPCHVVWLTGGDVGGKVAVRRAEAEAAADTLGLSVAERHFFGYKEGQVMRAKHKLAALIHELKPEVVVAPGFWENHPDHRAASRVTVAACSLSERKPDVWAYEVWTPFLVNFLLKISPQWPTKKKAIACYASQLKQRDYVALAEGLGRYRAAAQALGDYAEGYFVSPLSVYADLIDIALDLV